MMENKIKHQSLELGAIWLISSAILSKLIGAFFKIPLAADNCLGDIGFGYFSSFYDLLVPLSTLSISGFPVAISHFIAKYEQESDKQGISLVLKCSKSFLKTVCLVLTLFLIVLYFPLSSSTDSNFGALLCFLAILPSVALCTVISYYRGYFEGFSNMRPTAISTLIEALAKLILGYGFAYVTVRLTGNFAFAAAASLFGIFLGTLVSSLFLRSCYKRYGGNALCDYTKNIKIDKALKRSIISLSLTVAIASLSSGIISLIDTLTVRTVLGFSVENHSEYYFTAFKSLLDKTDIQALPTLLYGIKSKAHTIFNIFLTIAMAIGVTAMPSLSKSDTQKGRLKSVNTALRFVSLFTFPIAGGFIVIAQPIMALLFGDGASSQIGGKILAIYGVAVIFAGFSIVLANVLQALSRHTFVLKSIIFASVVKLALNIFLCGIPRFNIYACAFTTLIFYVILFSLEIFLLIKGGNFNSLKAVFLKPLIAGIISSLVAYFVVSASSNIYFTLVAVILAAVVYFAILFATRFFLPSDFDEIPLLDKIRNMSKKTKN